MRKDTTPARGKGSSKKPRPFSPAQRLGVKPTKEDRAVARQLAALHNSKDSPAIIKGIVHQVFWDLTRRYDFPLPNNWTERGRWLPYLAALVAHQRERGDDVTGLRYTWQPSPEESAELDAEEKAAADARAIFDFINSPDLPVQASRDIGDAMTELLRDFNPLSHPDVFAVAYPLALEKARADAKG